MEEERCLQKCAMNFQDSFCNEEKECEAEVECCMMKCDDAMECCDYDDDSDCEEEE